MQKSNEARNAFFVQRFKERYNEVWKSTGGTQESFAEAVGAVRGTKVSAQQVSKWKLGKNYPVECLEDIAKVLGVTVDYFRPQTDYEKYQNSSEYMDNLGKLKEETLEKIGLDEAFLLAVKRITSFDTDFPMYSPIIPQLVPNPLVSVQEVYPDYIGGLPINFKNPDGTITEADEAEIGIKRYTISPTAPMSERHREFLQIKRDGETYTLDPRDMLFLKEVQDKVAEYIEFLFAQRTKAMRREEIEALKYFVSRTGEHGFAFRGRITPEEMNKVDPFANWKRDNDGGIIIYKDERSGDKWQA